MTNSSVVVVVVGVVHAKRKCKLNCQLIYPHWPRQMKQLINRWFHLFCAHLSFAAHSSCLLSSVALFYFCVFFPYDFCNVFSRIIARTIIEATVCRLPCHTHLQTHSQTRSHISTQSRCICVGITLHAPACLHCVRLR